MPYKGLEALTLVSNIFSRREREFRRWYPIISKNTILTVDLKNRPSRVFSLSSPQTSEVRGDSS